MSSSKAAEYCLNPRGDNAGELLWARVRTGNRRSSGIEDDYASMKGGAGHTDGALKKTMTMTMQDHAEARKRPA